MSAVQADLEAQAVSQKTLLGELEASIASGEDSIPVDQREQYRRVVRQLGADALAAVEGGACVGCYTSVTAQTLNELINRESLTFCKSCGRLLYLAEGEAENSRAAGAPKGTVPWFKFPDRAWTTHTVVFGHWAALGLDLGPHHLGIDTGCVWGKSLTAVRLDDRSVFQVRAVEGRAPSEPGVR